ncbi:MAG: hypothetical protein ACE15C_01250 [Phycisphaerae bacterium]
MGHRGVRASGIAALMPALAAVLFAGCANNGGLSIVAAPQAAAKLDAARRIALVDAIGNQAAYSRHRPEILRLVAGELMRRGYEVVVVKPYPAGIAPRASATQAATAPAPARTASAPATAPAVAASTWAGPAGAFHSSALAMARRLGADLVAEVGVYPPDSPEYYVIAIPLVASVRQEYKMHLQQASLVFSSPADGTIVAMVTASYQSSQSRPGPVIEDLMLGLDRLRAGGGTETIKLTGKDRPAASDGAGSADGQAATAPAGGG